MDPMERMDYGHGGSGYDSWRLRDPMIGRYDEYEPWPASRSYGFGFGYGHGARDRFDLESQERREPGEHVWHGGILGWLGSGLRASAAWVGNRMQGWGALLGGKLKGSSAELGRAMRGRGEQMGSALEQRGEEAMRRAGSETFRGRPPRSYRRPDERILDDVHHRVSLTPVDAGDVEIEVSNGVVTLSGRVPRRLDKRLIEEAAEQVFGVQEVQNHLRLARPVEETGGPGAGTMAGRNGQPGFGGQA